MFGLAIQGRCYPLQLMGKVMRASSVSGDYISTSVLSGGNAYPVLPIASAPTGSTFDQAMFVPSGGLAVTGGSNMATVNAVAPPSSSASSLPSKTPVTAR